MLKPIETIYNGYKFRSRLEARWAVFFDELHISYSYEKEGYDLDGIWYLPDFWLPDWNCWVEIKPERVNIKKDSSDEKKNEEFKKCQLLSHFSNGVVLLIGGDPWANNEQSAEDGYYHHSYNITIFANCFLKQKNDRTQFGINVGFNFSFDSFFSRLVEDFYTSESRLYGHLKRNYKDHPEYFENNFCEKDNPIDYIDIDKEYYRRKFHKENPIWKYGIKDSNLGFSFKNGLAYIGNFPECETPDPILISAFASARQKRFERNA
ncbi:MAG: hypothetical protein WC679_13040 [Bacteroidales bacterium]|jgi:hypothetical protein